MDTFPFNLRLASKVKATARTPEIYRKNYSEYTIEYVERGIGYLHINRKKFEINADSIYILHRNSTHLYWPNRDDPWHKIYFLINGPMVDYLLNAYQLDELYHLPNCPELKHYFEDMLTIKVNSKSEQERAALCFHSLLAAISRHCYQLSNPISLPEQKLKIALDNSVNEPFKLEKYAHTCGISSTKLIHDFTATFGITPYEYLLTQRLDVAQRLLRYTSQSIKEIANTLAFTDQYHFSNFFKRKIGISPKKFRYEKNIDKSRG